MVVACWYSVKAYTLSVTGLISHGERGETIMLALVQENERERVLHFCPSVYVISIPKQSDYRIIPSQGIDKSHHE